MKKRIAIMIGLLCLLTVREAHRVGSADSGGSVPLRRALAHVFRVKAVWILGLTMLGNMGCMQGMSGYLPLYLRESGWTAASADGTLAASNGVSSLGAIPVTLLSDRLGLRKALMLPIIVMTIIGIALLSVFDNAMVWPLVIMVGIARDGFMALIITTTADTEGIGILYSGTAWGFVQTISRAGSIFSPPLGNSLAATNLGLPFVFWAAIAVVSLLSLCFVKETGLRKAHG